MEFLRCLKDQVLIIDGAMGTLIQDLCLSDRDFGGAEFKMLSDLLTLSRPHDLKKIHLEYLQAGAHAIETNTFGASELRLKEYNFSRLDVSHFHPDSQNLNLTRLSHREMAYLINQRAALIARRAVTEYQSRNHLDKRPLFVLGSIGPSNHVLSSTRANLNRASYEIISENFYHQALGLIDGEVDVLLFETQQDQLELKAGIHGVQAAMKDRGKRLPIMVQVTVDPFGRMQIFHTDILAVMTTVCDIGIDVFGINCSIGPDLMKSTVKKLGRNCPLPLSVVPNAGLPVSENGKTVFKLGPEELAAHLALFVEEFGVNLVGGCCGTRPDHIAHLSRRLKNTRPGQRSVKKFVFISGPQEAVVLDSSQGLIRIGERLNVRGSKKVKDAVESNGEIHFDALDEVAREQTSDLGVDIIDVCMDSNIVNTEEVLAGVIKHVTADFSGAMCLDSFSPEALIRALEFYPGRPVINSISLEEYAPGVTKADAIVSRAQRHFPVYIALCTGPEGPAMTAGDKENLARRIFETCQKKYGVQARQLIVDVNAFPIGSESREDQNFALESLNAIPLVKNIHPDIMVSMGVGNLTNGLAAKPYMRKLLTSVFIAEARQRGMDAAIINPHHYAPVESLDPAHVELARQVILKHNMDAFTELERIAEEKKGGAPVKKCAYRDMPLEEAICAKIKDGHKEHKEGIVKNESFAHAYHDAIVVQVSLALQKHDPLDFINNWLMKAMQALGDGFGRGEVSLPHLLKSADVMKHAMGYIEALMRHRSGVSVHDQIPYKGVVVIGTVYQDVHSIGKDLAKTLLENYGYRVIDLGVQTPLEKFIQTAREHRAQAIGMSALLVQTSNHMITVARMVQEAGLDVDILIGGAPVNYRHAASVAMWGQDEPARMKKNVFYCPSGMDGVNVMNKLVESEPARRNLIEENVKKLQWHREHAATQEQKEKELLKKLPRRIVDFSMLHRKGFHHVPVRNIRLSMKEFSPSLDLKTLFSLNWRYGGRSSWEKKGLSHDSLMRQLGEWVELCDQSQWLTPQAVYAVFPCQSSGDTVVIYDPQDVRRELARFDFTVVIGRGQNDIFSLAQYFHPVESKKMDVIGLQISTGGGQVGQYIRELKNRNNTEWAFLLQGLSDRVAEDMAEYAHGCLRKTLQLTAKEGVRFSPGYPGLRDLKVNSLLAKLLQAQKNLNIGLTDAHEFTPTGTTGAVVCFHPQARYD